MKVFSWRKVNHAVAYALDGGEALHLHDFGVHNGSPRCFQQAIQRQEPIAHLYDQTLPRLKLTARNLGVKIVVVEYIGGENQHVDLCGGPLKRLLTNHIDKMIFVGKVKQAESLIRHLEENYPGTKKWRLRG